MQQLNWCAVDELWVLWGVLCVILLYYIVVHADLHRCLQRLALTILSFGKIKQGYRVKQELQKKK